MLHEKSCGAIVYTTIGTEINYLIVQMQLGHFGFPKGHMEQGETERDTALREIREETGLTVCIDTSFRKSISYSPFEGCMKEVVYFIASASTTETTRQPEEIKSIQWLPLQQAFATLSYENDRANLKTADEYLRSRCVL